MRRASVYLVEFSSDGGVTWEQTSITTPPLVLDGLVAETTYLVRVAAATRAGQREVRWSDPIVITTKPAVPSLPAPTLRRVGVIGQGGVFIDWSVEPEANGTRVEIEPGGTSTVIPAGTATYELSGVAPGTEYFYSLSAVGDGTVRRDSPPLHGTFVYLGALPDPIEVTATATGQHTVDVEWSTVPRASEYIVVVQHSSSSTEVASVRHAVSPQRVDGLTANTAYTVTVLAWGQTESSDPEAVLSTESPGLVSAAVTTLAEGDLGLTWEQAADEYADWEAFSTAFATWQDTQGV